MPVRGLLAAVIVLGILAGGVYWSEQRQKAEEAKQASGGESKLVHVKDEDVAKIELHSLGASPVILERDKSRQWQMKAPETWRVDQDAAGSVVSTYTGLSYDRVVEDNASDLASYGLQTPPVEAIFTGNDGKARKLQLGDETPTGAAIFAKFEGEPRVFTLTGSTKSSLQKTANDLRDKRLLVFDTEKLTRVELASKGATVEFGRNAQKEWQIVKPNPYRADNLQVDELVRKLGDARMDTSAPPQDAAFASAARIGTATVTDASGTQSLEVRKKGEDYLAKGSAIPGVFKIGADIGEALNKGVDDFRNKKLFDFGFSDPSALSLRNEATSYAFTKSGEKWTSAAGKTMDPTSVQAFIDKVRDLTSIRFRDTGFGAANIELSVTSDSGKRVEKVQISKNGNSYFARREGEPALYELDSKAVEELLTAAADVKEPPPPAKK